MAKKFSEVMEEMRDAVLGRKKNHDWGGSATDALDATVQGVKGFGGDTLSKTAARFNEATPYIIRAGYDVVEIEVGLGLSPKIVAHLELRELISDEARAELLLEVDDKRIISTILNTLFRASAARRRLSFKRFHFTHLELELSILPTVVLKFKPGADATAGDVPLLTATELPEED